MIAHISIGVRDLVPSKRFYDAVLEPLGYKCLRTAKTLLGYGYGRDSVSFWIFQAERPVPADARSTQHLFEITERVKSKGVALHVLDLGVDTSTATGKLLFMLTGLIATFERELMLERQREGIARAKAEGKYKGRKPTARARATEIAALKADGVRPVDIARTLGIGRASVYRVLGADIQS
jgi:hypothetical protein